MSALAETRDHARRMAKAGGPDQGLWKQIADEIDEYLAGPVEVVDLFGDTTVEPVRQGPERCPDCDWVEIRQMCDPVPEIVRGHPCEVHA